MMDLIMKNIFIIAVAFIICSCGGTYEAAWTYHFDKSKTIPLSYDKVWQNTIDWFAINNTPIKTLDKASGIIASDYNLRIGSENDYCDCGKITRGLFLNYSLRDYTGNINVLARKVSDDSTKITISSFFKANRILYDSNERKQVFSDVVNCNSTGRIEREFFQAIQK